MTLISKYRAALMGFSMLWIMLFHSKVIFPNAKLFFPFEIIKESGYAGVEIFFLLSGVGLAFSLKKGDPVLKFYKKRFIKVVPLFLIASVLMYWYELHASTFQVLPFLIKVSGLDVFHIGASSFFWFIPIILCFYLLAPLLYELLKKRKPAIILFISLIYLSLLAAVIQLHPDALIWYTRIPIFVFGLYVGILLSNQESNRYLESFALNFAIALLSITVLVVIFQTTSDEYRWKTGLWWYPTVVLAYPLTYCLATVFEWANLNLPSLVSVLTFIGRHTLELYIVHAFIYKLSNELSLTSYKWNIYRFPEYSIYLAASILTSIILRKQINRYS